MADDVIERLKRFKSGVTNNNNEYSPEALEQSMEKPKELDTMSEVFNKSMDEFKWSLELNPGPPIIPINSGSQENTQDKTLFQKKTPKLGSMDPKTLIIDRDGERISRSLVDIKIEMEEGMIELAAENILLLERTPDDTLTITEVERQLSTISAYRFAFIRASAIIGKQIKQKKRELNRWLAEERRDILKDVGRFRNRLKEEESFTGSWFGSVTKDEVQERLELNPNYGSMCDIIETLEEQHEILDGLQDTLFQHSSNLRRLYERLNFEKSKT